MRPHLDSWVRKFPWRRYRLPTPVFWGFPHGSDGKESTCNARDLGLIPGLGRSPGGGHGNPLQYSFQENPMDWGAWRATFHGVTKSQTRLSNSAQHISLGVPGGSDGKEPACNTGDLGLVHGLGRSPGGGLGNPLNYSCLENPHGIKSLAATVHGIAKSQTGLSE